MSLSPFWNHKGEEPSLGRPGPQGGTVPGTARVYANAGALSAFLGLDSYLCSLVKFQEKLEVKLR